MSKTNVSAGHSTALMLGVALCVAFFTIGITAAHAEEAGAGLSNFEVSNFPTEVEELEDDDNTGVSVDFEVEKKPAELDLDEEVKASTKEDDEKKREAMKKQIESLKKTIDDHKNKTQEEKAVVKAEKDEAKAEKKELKKIDRSIFVASLEGLNEEEKKAAMLEFIEDIKATIEAQKNAMKEQMEAKKEKKEEVKASRLESREEFQASIEGLSGQEKVAAIMERLSAIATHIEEVENEEDKYDDDEYVPDTTM